MYVTMPQRVASRVLVAHQPPCVPSKLRQLLRCTATRSSTSVPPLSPVLQRIGRRAKSPEELNDPAKIGATGNASTRFAVLPTYESLSSYMLLPVEQYFVLDPKQIAHLGGNRFVLTVPRINLFNVWLEAVVEVSVVTSAAASSGLPRVVLQAENCRISGSDAVEALKLDQRFCMRFQTELTWKEAATAAAGSSVAHTQGAGNGGAAQPMQQQGEIRADSRLDVWSEVVSPFHLLPRDVLVATCNSVLRGLVASLLPLFVRQLAEDYQRWAADPAYRAERAARSKPLA